MPIQSANPAIEPQARLLADDNRRAEPDITASVQVPCGRTSPARVSSLLSRPAEPGESDLDRCRQVLIDDQHQLAPGVPLFDHAVCLRGVLPEVAGLHSDRQ